MKTTFQWLSAIALMVMTACAFVACSDDDDNNSSDGNWTAAKDTKILGSWQITDYDTEAPSGPGVGSVMTFKSDGSFVQGRDKGTFKYNNETGAFSAKMGEMSMKGTFTVSEDGESMSGVCNVTQGKQTFAYRMSFVKYTGDDEGGDGDDEGGDGGDTDWSEGILDARMIGTWTITVDEDVPSSKGQTATFNANGTCTIGGHSYTYSTKTDTNKGEDRIKFTLYLDGEAVNEGRLVLVCGGGVLNGEYWTPGQKQDRNMALVMKKPNFTYPSGGVKGRWKITTVNMNDGPSVGEVIVFNSEGEMYIEGDAHVNHYTYSGNDSGGTLNIELDKDGDIPGTLTISNGIATFEVGGQPAIVLQKQ